MMFKSVISVIGTLGLASISFASRQTHKPVEDAAKDATLVFEGEVTKIEYKNSNSDQQQPKGIPHTFVTYKVLQVLRGKAAASFTLRFMGGLDPKGIAAEISHYPSFDVGDRDILFVKGNTLKACPLVSCGQGRFRIEKNKVYTDEARTVLMTDKAKIGLGRVQPLASAIAHTYVHPTTGKSVVVQTKGSQEEVTAPEPTHLSVDAFKKYLVTITKGLPEPTAEKSALIAQPIVAIGFMPLAAPITLPPATQVAPQDQQEIVEMEKLKASNGNPVVK